MTSTNEQHNSTLMALNLKSKDIESQLYVSKTHFESNQKLTQEERDQDI